ncbi:hypothetical protein EUGRSUZ_E02700 [Eucalyptus grandis]|uniref:Uncharacterized protein n=2 Tax=Eucalyptus grandis TaxID=71139 RepID=A0ACC3KYJ8_EUCGR|nr:hypothetical protein EUGRSUZ_E02700 [Eucalyptus grandis]
MTRYQNLNPKLREPLWIKPIESVGPHSLQLEARTLAVEVFEFTAPDDTLSMSDQLLSFFVLFFCTEWTFSLFLPYERYALSKTNDAEICTKS